MVIRFLIAVHRWLGVSLCLLFLLWFPSGIGMMYWGMPAVSARDRLERAPVLDPGTVLLSPHEAAERIGVRPQPATVRLSSFDTRPVYRFGGGGRGGIRIVYADTGEEQLDASPPVQKRAAAAWTGQPVSAATIERVTEPDQWMVGNQLRSLRPLWKYSWPNGEQVYIGETGEVLMYTTRASRLKAYLSAVPHWLYFTPLRKHQPIWIRFATYAAMIGTVGAIIGVVLGAWLYSPRKKYRYDGMPSRIPYRGQKRWHTILGLIFGAATISWMLSGSLAFLPFPTPQRTPARAQALGAAPAPRLQGQAGGGRRGGSDGMGLSATLHGELTMDDIAAVHPRDILARHREPGVKELSFASLDGTPLYTVGLGDGTTRTFTFDGRPSPGLDPERIVQIVRSAVPDPRALEFRTVQQYDYYYLDRNRQRPLPVLLALTHDADGTRHYIDPGTGAVATLSDRNWARRFFYNGLHSLSFPWLYNHRPLWDIVVIAFMIGGTALCVTALALAWRAVGRRLRRAAQRVVLAAAVLALFVDPDKAAAQTTLAEVKSLRCTFTRQTTGSWSKEDAPEATVRPSSLVLRFESIDTESGTARLRNGAMATEVTVRLAEGYLHLMQAFRTGPLYTTTVFAAGATARGFKAAHSRHELFTTPLPGATSSPKQDDGTCEAGR